MIRYHIGTEKQLKVRKRLELIIVVLFSPIWFPMIVIAAVFDFIAEMIEYVLDSADDCVRNLSNWVASKFVR